MQRKNIWIYITAVVLLAIGLYRHEPADVWQRAATICLECIGIG